MLKCALNKKQLLFIIGTVADDLKNIDPKTFDVQEYATKWYNKIKDAVQDPEQKHAKALDFTRAALYYIPSIEARNRDIAKNLLEADIDYKGLRRLVLDITEEKVGLQKLEDYLNVKAELADEIRQLNNAAKAVKPEPKTEPKSDVVSDTKPPILGVLPQTRPSDLPASKFEDLLVPTALATGTAERYNEPEDFEHKVQRKILRDLIKLNYDFSKLTIQGVPAFLSFKINSKGNGVVMRLTDADGYEFRFDEETLEPVTEGGKIPFFPVKIPELNAKGEIKVDKNITNTINFIAKNSFNGDTKLAYQNLKDQIKFLNKIKNHVIANPESFVPVQINGGTLGYALIDYQKSTKLNTLQGVPKVIDFHIASTDDPARGIEKGFTYFYVDGFYEQPVILERPFVDEIPDLVDKLTSLMVDDIIDSTTGKPMSAAKRQSLIDTFVYTESNQFQVIVKEDLTSYDLLYNGNKISLEDKEQAKQLVKDHLSKIEPKRVKKYSDLTENQKKNIVTSIPDNPKINMVLEEEVDGKKVYKVFEKQRLNIKDTSKDGDKIINNTLPDVNLTEKDGVIIAEPKEDTKYSTFLKEYGSVNYNLANNQLRKYGSYFTFQPIDETYGALTGEETPTAPTVEPTKKVDAPASTQVGPSVGKFKKIDSKTIQDNIDKDRNEKKTWNRTFDQKNTSVAATLEQIKAAKKWYENHPMRNLIPFEVMFHVANTDGKNAVATINRTGITLYKGSNYADLYHEAWHGFTQYFLTIEEKEKLYKEVSKKSGSFKDFQGRRVTFSDATPEQIEEYLAEEFRSYMLKGQKAKKDAPVRNSIFRKIYNILKALFSNSTVREINRDAYANKVVNDMFENLRVGNINTQSFTQENVMFDKLNRIKPYGKTVKEDSISGEPLSSQNTTLLMESVNSLFTEYTNLVNLGLDNFETYRKLNELRDDVRNATTVKQKELIQNQIDALTKGAGVNFDNTTSRFASGGNMLRAYQAVYNEFVDKYNDLVKEYEDGGSQDESLLNSINLLDTALENFGDLETLSNNIFGDINSVKGVIGYHMYLNREFYSKDDILDYENLSEDELNIKGESYEKNRQAKELAKKELVWLISSLHAYDKDGDAEFNKLGFRKTVKPNEVWNRLFRTAENVLEPAELYKALQKEKELYPPIAQLLDLLGPMQTTSISASNTWTNLWQVLSSPRVKLTQMGVEITEKDGVETIETKIGEAFSSDRKSETKWNTQLALRPEDKFTVKDSLGNKLNLQNIIKSFQYRSDNPNERLAGREIEFFKALGWNIVDVEEFRPGGLHYKELNGIASRIRVKIIELNGRDNIAVRSIADLTKAYPKTINAAGEELDISGDIEGRFKRVQTLNSRYSNEDYSFMSTTADGNAQSEHPLNSSLTIQIHYLNNAKDYQELITIPGLTHLNVETNPRAGALTMLQSLFELDVDPSSETYGRRRVVDGKPVQIQLTNGISVQDQLDYRDGQSSAKADATSKLIQEFYLTNQMMLPELMRAADKSTSLSATLTNVKGEDDKFYIGIEKFLPFKANYQEDAYNYLVPHLDAEFQRIKLFKSIDRKSIKNFDFKYFDRGLTFNEFDDILDESKEIINKALNNKKETRTLTEILDANPLLKASLKSDFKKYFDAQVENVAASLEGHNFISKTLFSQLKNELKNKNERDQVKIENATEALVKAFVYNNFINNIETIGMFYGDLALYNHYKEEFHKRNAGIISTGTLFRHDDAMRDLINELGRGYSDKYFPENKYESFDGTFNTAVIKDADIPSAYYDNYVEAFTKHFVKVEKLSAAKAKAKAEEILKPYLEMTEGDAQGWVGFDSYRILKIAEGAWTSQQEDMYKEIVKNGTVADLEGFTQFFPPYKPQYFGNLNTDNVDPRLKHLPLVAFHKFSLVPLVPGMVAGKNLENLHAKMINEGVDYVLFESGSKVSTITKDGTPDAFYKDIKDRSELSEEPFTINKIHFKYLKNQVEIAPEWKGKSIFSTQLRKLIEDGTMMNGVPNDYLPGTNETERMNKWNALSDEAKQKQSPTYKLLKAYEDDIRLLTELKKEELLKEMGWSMKEVNGKMVPQGNIENLITFAINELDRQDLPRHAIDFLSVNKDGSLKRDLSYSLYSDKIETVLTSLVINRLVKQKVVGENLVQFSGALAENTGSFKRFDKPTAEQLEEYGSNQLPTYMQKYDKDGNPLPTTAAKVKIAMQGQFKYLLEMEHPDGGKIGTIESLNKLLKDDTWLDTDDNRKMVTMIGPRIPVQGLNSMEYMEIYEFLPESAGNIIIPPAEIVAKSGSDFDIDKLSVYMPNIGISREKYKLTYKGLKEIQEQFPELDFSMDNVVEIKRLAEEGKNVGQDGEEILEILKSYDKATIQYKTDDSVEGVQNRIISNIASILRMPENFVSLVRPIDAEALQTLASELSGYVLEYDSTEVVNGDTRLNDKGKPTISPTRVLEINYNIYKHASNNIGGQTLGLGAVDNTYNAIFNRIGFYLNPTNGISTKQYEKLKAKANPTKSDKWLMQNYLRQTLYLNHNTLDIAGEKAISLSHLYDADKEFRVSDIINQMMNGWVDIAKDAWIFNIQGNKEVAPALLFMIQAGVPLKDAVYFASMPLVREYVKEQQLAKAALAKVMKTAPEHPNFFRVKARTEILNKIGLSKPKKVKTDVWLNSVSREAADEYFGKDKTFNKEDLLQRIKDYKAQGAEYEYGDLDKLAFLHFLEIEEMSKVVRDIKMTVNFDTDKTGSLFAAQDKQLAIQELKANPRFSAHFVNKIIDDTPIGSFNVQDFQLEVFQDLFPFKSNKLLNDTLFNIIANGDKSDDIKTYFGDTETFANAYKSDLLNYIYQNELRDFNPKAKYYKGSAVEPVRYLGRGASLEITEDGYGTKLYVDLKTIKDHYNEKGDESWSGYFKKHDLYKVPRTAFETEESYIEFVFERESLRKTLTPAKAVNNPIYKYIEQTIKAPAKIKGESTEDYNNRVESAVYEKFLATTALTNVYNHWQLFNSDLSYATQYEILKQAYPELEEDFSVLTNIVADGKNLKLVTPRLDKQMTDTMYENLEVLSNNNKIKIDRETTDILSNFFSKIPHVAFLQSGFNTKSIYALTAFVNPEPVYGILESAAKKYARHMDAVLKSKADDSKISMTPSLLNDYTKAFFDQNRDRRTRIRGKNYYTGYTVDESIKQDVARTMEYPLLVIDNFATKVQYRDFLDLDYDTVDVIKVKEEPTDHMASISKNYKVKIVPSKITVDNFFDYFMETNAQKKATLPILQDHYNISVADLKGLIKTKEQAIAFVLFHEESHKLNDDHNNPKVLSLSQKLKAGKITREEYLMHPDMIDIEARANADAFIKLYSISSNFFEKAKPVKDLSIKIKPNTNSQLAYDEFSGSEFPNNMDINKFMEDNPDHLIVINGTVSGKTGGTAEDIQLSNVKDEYKNRIVILPTGKTNNSGGGFKYWLDQSELSEEDIANINDKIDSKIEEIKEKAEINNLKIAFNKDGYGSYMVESTKELLPESKAAARRLAPDIFKNLSMKLFDNFNYINPNFIADYNATGRNHVQQLQPVSDTQVREFLKNLLNCK
ncbi:MAG: hypothetical protein ACW964_01135 [Candidatus Hodarchaeales archaeon]|jgi:hypothetical protein